MCPPPVGGRQRGSMGNSIWRKGDTRRDLYFIAKHSAPALHLARPDAPNDVLPGRAGDTRDPNSKPGWRDDGVTCGESHLEEGRGLEAADPQDVVRRVRL